MSDDRGPRLITRCRHCDTAFRVYEHQLTKREGQVRCGACGSVFNAYDSLEDENPDPLRIDGPPSLMPRDPDVPTGSPEAARNVDLPLESGDALRNGESRGRAGEGRQEPIDFPLEAGAAESDSYLSEDGGDYDFGGGRLSPRRRALYIASIGLLTVLLVLQSLVWFRDEIAGRMPMLGGALRWVCAPLGCQVGLPRRADQLVIEGSELQTESNGLLRLTATIRNNASYLQAQPMLEVTLTDPRDQPVVRKVLAPADYLEPAALAAGSLPARGDLVARVYLDASAAPANGYRLLVFYP